jgi:hypothetical protein
VPIELRTREDAGDPCFYVASLLAARPAARGANCQILEWLLMAEAESRHRDTSAQ